MSTVISGAKVILGVFACICLLWGAIFTVVAVYVAARALVRAITGRPRRPADGKPLTWQEKRVLRALRRDLERQDASQPAYDERGRPLCPGSAGAAPQRSKSAARTRRQPSPPGAVPSAPPRAVQPTWSTL